jgi:predicted phosphodiesterase
MRIAVISDIHANLPALEAVLATVGSVDVVWHLGDVVGYGPHPDEVIGRLAEIGAVGVRGNHDAAATGDLDTEWFNDDARRAIEWTQARLAAPSRSWLAALPERLEVERATLVHGSPRDPIWEYVTSSSLARRNLEAFATPVLLHGHTHVPIAFRERDGQLDMLQRPHRSTLLLDERRVLVNPGSVGQPRDGDPRASAMVWDTEAATLTWHRIEYPIELVQRDMRRAGLPARLSARLAVGL